MDYASLQKQFDTTNMLARIDEWPDIFKRGFELGFNLELPPGFSEAKKVVCLGMGGSGMAYTILSVLSRQWGSVPVEVISDYHLPPYVTEGSGTAVCVTSFSGNTEETLSAAHEAFERGLPIICITTGGKLAPWAKEHNIPVAQFEYPVGPRTGLSYTFGISLGVFVSAQFLQFDKSGEAVVDQALEQLKSGSPIAALQAEGQNIAEGVKNKMIYMVGAGFSFPIAARWKAQFNENAKNIAFSEPMPEMCHNMYLGYDLPESVRTNSAVIFLDSQYDHPQNLKRAQLVGGDFEATGVTVVHPKTNSTLSPLATLLAQIILGDYASYYLALVNGKDPSEMDRIEDLKKRL